MLVHIDARERHPVTVLHKFPYFSTQSRSPRRRVAPLHGLLLMSSSRAAAILRSAHVQRSSAAPKKRSQPTASPHTAAGLAAAPAKQRDLTGAARMNFSAAPSRDAAAGALARRPIRSCTSSVPCSRSSYLSSHVPAQARRRGRREQRRRLHRAAASVPGWAAGAAPPMSPPQCERWCGVLPDDGARVVR